MAAVAGKVGRFWQEYFWWENWVPGSFCEAGGAFCVFKDIKVPFYLLSGHGGTQYVRQITFRNFIFWHYLRQYILI